MTTKALRNKAADYIEAHGWCRFKLMDSKGRVCVVGALNAAQTGHPEQWRSAAIRKRAIDQLRREVGATAIDHWNDKPGRTKAEVIARLRGMPLPEPPQ